ncbi:MAG TPA: nitrilase-related carbon-nitrogen hydrolase [Acidobacteriaceae bacterium]|nr:nitrilase-related carbon-nitrogen hydrolase [Acidobacteriaceae bacterium]
MGFGGKMRDLVMALLAIAATALLMFFGNGLEPHWPLAWFVPLPVLLYALRSSVWRGGAVAFLGMLLGCLNFWNYFRVLSAPAIAWFANFTLMALFFAVGVLLTRALARRGALWSAWIALPAWWVSFEFVRNLLWPHGSGGSVAYTQLNFLPFLQFASLAGPWGMGFVLMLFPTGLALAIHMWCLERRQAGWMLGLTLGVVAAVLTFGAVRLARSQPGPEVKVGIVASDVSQGVADPGASAQRLFEQYAEQAQGLIAHGARVVVMPEDLAVIVDPNTAGADAIFQRVADSTGAVLVVGMNHVSGPIRHNEARIYAPSAPVRSYDKEHLLPPFENIFTPGTSRTTLVRSGQTWGVAICKDMDFTDPARGYGRAGVGLLLAPAWDFQLDAFWHGHIAVMRAVEDGFSLVRSARGGFLTVADDRGRILAEIRSNSAPFATLWATVPAGHDATLFQSWGDWFGWYAVALLALVVLRLVFGPRRSAIS